MNSERLDFSNFVRIRVGPRKKPKSDRLLVSRCKRAPCARGKAEAACSPGAVRRAGGAAQASAFLVVGGSIEYLGHRDSLQISPFVRLRKGETWWRAGVRTYATTSEYSSFARGDLMGAPLVSGTLHAVPFTKAHGRAADPCGRPGAAKGAGCGPLSN